MRRREERQGCRGKIKRASFVLPLSRASLGIRRPRSITPLSPTVDVDPVLAPVPPLRVRTRRQEINRLLHAQFQPTLIVLYSVRNTETKRRKETPRHLPRIERSQNKAPTSRSLGLRFGRRNHVERYRRSPLGEIPRLRHTQTANSTHKPATPFPLSGLPTTPIPRFTDKPDIFKHSSRQEELFVKSEVNRFPQNRY